MVIFHSYVSLPEGISPNPSKSYVFQKHSQNSESEKTPVWICLDRLEPHGGPKSQPLVNHHGSTTKNDMKFHMFFFSG